ncbi:hypothetical protein [Aquimonas sp.]|jgi:hypothetical protein|uniref:hypothetical protein n=1 Tax=Aquimonas sp. TaxID=1872588 RepID=UPI0037C0EFA7
MLTVRSALNCSTVLALALVSASAKAEDLTFTLTNNSSFVVVEFYASPSDVGEWEEDILGTGVLGSGEYSQITIGDGREQCEYDLRFVFDDGDVVDRGGVNLCETGSYTLTD